uniref:Uncharacterized protein n=1 Tax=Spongospora subterranea TaxID=70186 RepID=A0A0H5RLU5_9EUKA|eukprot:CRZ09699.1 hypothetical protein [Spongospora subterranea]
MERRLALWLVPEPDGESYCEWWQISSRVASIVSPDCSPVSPHITLSLWTVPFSEPVADHIPELVPDLESPIILNTRAISTTDSFWMCIFADVCMNDELARICNRTKSLGYDVNRILNRPHASVVYSNLDPAQRQHIVSSVNSSVPDEFVATRIVLIDTTEQDHTQWQTIEVPPNRIRRI